MGAIMCEYTPHTCARGPYSCHGRGSRRLIAYSSATRSACGLTFGSWSPRNDQYDCLQNNHLHTRALLSAQHCIN